jgi:alanyl-tRNA synthetase
MTAKELREKYLQFFKEKGHVILPSAPLVPENDPTVLFTTAGMHPLVPFLLGEDHPAGKRIASVQKCVRTGDIDEVGDNWHLTFFEMLGNWSLGDYFKKEAIEWSHEFLTDKKWLGLDKNKLAVSVFAGDNDAPFDEEAYKIWRDLGVPEERIARLPKEDNWWGPAGQTGPCGPDTEIFYWAEEGDALAQFDPKDKSWVEIWNNVFMEYKKIAEGKYEPLTQKNIDTGMGLERTVAVLNGYKSVYETELFKPLLDMIEKKSGKKYKGNERVFRIIADHMKAAIIILGDKNLVVPSNVGQGYVLRRLIRRATVHAYKLGIKIGEEIFATPFVRAVIEMYRFKYPELELNGPRIYVELNKEYIKFSQTLEGGLRELNKIFDSYLIRHGKRGLKQLGVTDLSDIDSVDPILTGKNAFNLYSTYGLPIEVIKDFMIERDLIFGENFEKEFNEEFIKHQELSRTASAGKFKGGLADASEEVKKLHTATHLLHTALRKVLGEHVEQRGSNITAERLRFDFSHSEKMTSEEIKKVEEIVNEEIKKSAPVICEIMPVDKAKEKGAIGLFGDKYGDMVKVYSIEGFSKEICGGPHVQNTGELGYFKIVKEEASSAGTRRIKAVLE